MEMGVMYICLERCEVVASVSSSSRVIYIYIELCVFLSARGERGLDTIDTTPPARS